MCPFFWGLCGFSPPFKEERLNGLDDRSEAWGRVPIIHGNVDGWNPIPNHLGWCWNPINNGKNYQPQLVIAGFQPSTVCLFLSPTIFQRRSNLKMQVTQSWFLSNHHRSPVESPFESHSSVVPSICLFGGPSGNTSHDLWSTCYMIIAG